MKSIDLPVGVGPKGSIKSIQGSDHTQMLIEIAFVDCSSANPFQVLGFGDAFIFQIDSSQEVNRSFLVI